MRFRSGLLGAIAVGAIASGLGVWSARASDHDDGENDNKARALNLTDVYAFREDWQTGNPADAGNLIVIMNVNPRSLPRQPYYFSTNARYELHFGRVTAAAVDLAPTGLEDVILRFEFGPESQGTQLLTATWVEGGEETVASPAIVPASTTSLENSTNNTAFSINDFTANGHTFTVFAGLREDPFFFDVESFFRMRGGEGVAAIRTTSEAVDFTSGYNVSSIVTRIPIAALAGAGDDDKFDIWATVSLGVISEGN